MEGPRSRPSVPLPVLLGSVLGACLVAATVAGCTYYQVAPAAPSGPSTFDRSWNAALGAADDCGVSVNTADRTSGYIYATSPTGGNVTITVFTQADGRVRVAFNVKSPAGPDSDLANRLHRAYEARMGR